MGMECPLGRADRIVKAKAQQEFQAWQQGEVEWAQLRAELERLRAADE